MKLCIPSAVKHQQQVRVPRCTYTIYIDAPFGRWAHRGGQHDARRTHCIPKEAPSRGEFGCVARCRFWKVCSARQFGEAWPIDLILCASGRNALIAHMRCALKSTHHPTTRAAPRITCCVYIFDFYLAHITSSLNRDMQCAEHRWSYTYKMQLFTITLSSYIYIYKNRHACYLARSAHFGFGSQCICERLARREWRSARHFFVCILVYIYKAITTTTKSTSRSVHYIH